MIYLCFDYRNAPLDKLLAVVPETERQRIISIKNQDKQLQSAAAWALLSLAENLDLNTETIRDKSGKPQIPAAKHCFSLSHCDACVAVAVSGEGIGIDVERIKDGYPEVVASRVFGEKARKEIADAAEPAREFYVKWTQYESFVKAFGADADFFRADGSLFRSEVIDGVALSVCCNESQEIKILPVSAVFS